MVRVCLALLTILAMTGVSFAQNEVCWKRPPARYVHEPLQPYTVTRVDLATLRSKCNQGAFGFAPTVMACADTQTNEIWIRTDLPSPEGQWLSCVLQHEKAHLNGWPYNHPIR